MRADVRADLVELFEACGAKKFGRGESYPVEWRISDKDLNEFLEKSSGEVTGRITERLHKQGISRDRTERLVDGLTMVRNTIGDLVNGFSKAVEPRRWVEQVQASIDAALKK